MRARDFDRAIDACYDTVVAPETWPAAFDALAGAAGCMFRRRTDEGAILDLPMPESLRDFMTDYVREGYAGNDYRATVGWPLVRRETVLIDHDIVPDEVRRSLPLMADLHIRHDLPWWAGVAFGLTPAEARLACRLAGGESLEAAADALGIAKNTARVQLKAVLAKTGTGRQGELIALLARLAR